jgi:hypothetical protein
MYMFPCMNKQLFGIDCPGCGAQRAAVFIFKGDFISAFHMFPAIYTTIILFAFITLHIVDKSRKYHTIVIGTAILNGAIMLISYIYKMHQIFI